MSHCSRLTDMTKLLLSLRNLLLKPLLCVISISNYFNQQLPETFQVDASGVGVGGALLQDD